MPLNYVVKIPNQTNVSQDNADLSRVSPWHGFEPPTGSVAAQPELTPTGGEIQGYEPQSVWQRLAGVRVPNKIVWK